MSAARDGETDPREPVDWAHQHVADCVDCADWVDQVARLDRSLRIAEVVDDDCAELTESLSRQLRVPRRGPVLRATLALVALAQLVLGVVDMFGLLGMNMPGMSMPHLDHEEAAFNIAFGIALAMVAGNGRRAGGQVPVFTAFVLVLAGSSLFDLADGAVTWSRLLTHLPILIGLLLCAALRRVPEPDSDPLTGTGHRGRWSARGRSAAQQVGGAASDGGRQAPPAARRGAA